MGLLLCAPVGKNARIAAENAVGVVLGDGWAVGHLGSTATCCKSA